MCGRYYIDDEMIKEIEKIVANLDATFSKTQVRTGEIFPSNQSLILLPYQTESGFRPEMAFWGLRLPSNNNRIINARSETALERPLFQHSLLHNRRCIIPSSGFYEWDSSKNKIYFCRQDDPILFMAGLYRPYQNENQFTILTTAANESMQKVHHRMPLILQREQLLPWLYDTSMTAPLLQLTPPALHKKTEYEQTRLDFS